MNLDQKQPGFPADVLPRYLEARGVPFRIVEQDTYSVVKRVIPEGGTLCSLCSRLRRGAIYRVAAEIGATKIALGHHRDDVLATFFLNLFFGGKLKTMPPKLVSDDGRHVVIRPLVYVRERDLARYAELNAFPIIPCNLCGSQEHLQRRQVTAMLREWEKKYPGRIDSIFGALGNVVPSHLMDRALFDFAAVRATGRAVADGDIAFDVDPVLERAADLAAAGAAVAHRHHRHQARRRRLTAGTDPAPPAMRPFAGFAVPRLAAIRVLCAGVGCAAAGAVARRRAAAPADTAPAAPTLAGAALLQRAARRRLRPLLPAHGDGFRPERREDDGLRGLRDTSATSPTADAPTRARSAPRSARSAFPSATSSRARSAGRARPRS